MYLMHGGCGLDPDRVIPVTLEFIIMPPPGWHLALQETSMGFECMDLSVS